MNGIPSLKTPFFTVFFIFLGLFIYGRFLGPLPFSGNIVQTTKTDLFTVQGNGKESAIPDMAEVSLGITTTKPTVAVAQNEANTIINRISADLKSLGIEEKNIKTTSYNISPSYSFEEGRQRVNGYTVSVSLEVKITKIDRINDVIDTATRDGANMVNGVQFTFTDETRKRIEEKARIEAVKNAKEKAQSLANAAGISLGRIINVTESTNVPGPILFNRLQAGGGGQGEPTKVEPGESAITISITLTYEIN